MGVGSLELM
jgi:hypothetical protein